MMDERPISDLGNNNSHCNGVYVDGGRLTVFEDDELRKAVKPLVKRATEQAIKQALDSAVVQVNGCETFKLMELLEKLSSGELRVQKYQWISVKDRLPNIDEDVLVLARGKGCVEGLPMCAVAHMVDHVYYTAVPTKTEPRWRCPVQFFLTDYEITHWMPLPSTEGLEDAR